MCNITCKITPGLRYLAFIISIGMMLCRPDFLSAQPNPCIVDTTAWMTNGEVKCIVSSREFVYIGGSFTWVGRPPYSGSYLILDENRRPRYDFPQANGPINVCVSDRNGGWFIGGKFSKVGSFNRNNIAYISSGGTVDPWDPNADGAVGSIALDSLGNVYVAGAFNSIGGQPRKNIAKLNASGSAQSWFFNTDQPVNALACDKFNNLYVGGSFTQIGGQSRTYIAKIDSSGKIDPWSPLLDKNVTKITFDNRGCLYLCGQFSSYDRWWAKGIAKVFPGGELDTLFPQLELPSQEYVNTLCFDTSNNLYIGGTFSKIGGIPQTGLAKIKPDGTIDTSFIEKKVNGKVNSIFVDKKNDVYIGGAFTQIGGQNRFKFAKITEGKVDTSIIQADKYSNADVSLIYISGNNHVFIAGAFWSLGGVTRNRLARIKSDGTADSWDPDVNNLVTSIQLDAEENIYIGGRFEKIGGDQSRRYLAKFNKAGYLTSWKPSPETWYEVNAMALTNDGTLFYSSSFFPDTLFRVTPDGKVSAVFSSVNKIRVLCASHNGNIFFAGLFDEILGQKRKAMAECTPAGELTPWNKNEYDINYIFEDRNRNLFVSGNTNKIDYQSCVGMAKFTPDRSLDSWKIDFQTPKILGGSFAIDNKSDIYLAAYHDRYYNCIFKIKSNGIVDSTIIFANNGINCLSLDSSGHLYAGGRFSSIHGQNTNYFAKMSTFGDTSTVHVTTVRETSKTHQGIKVHYGNDLLTVLTPDIHGTIALFDLLGRKINFSQIKTKDGIVLRPVSKILNNSVLMLRINQNGKIQTIKTVHCKN